MKKIIWLFVLCYGLVASSPVQAKPAEDDAKPEIEREMKLEVDAMTLRPALEIEQAVMEYMLAYEAYQSARKSKDQATRGKMVEYMKQYREAYAKFLSMMRADKLYEPQKPKNPAGRYNLKLEKDKGYKRGWKNTAANELRAEIKTMVQAGATPKEIKAKIVESLPKKPMSSDPSDNPDCPPLPPRPPKPPLGGDPDDDDDDDDDDKDGDDDRRMDRRIDLPDKTSKPIIDDNSPIGTD